MTPARSALSAAVFLVPLLACSCGPPTDTTVVVGGGAGAGTGATGGTSSTTGGAGSAVGGGSGGSATTGSGTTTGPGGSGNCGNGMIDPGEACDGKNLGGATCDTQGFPGGTLGCTDKCTFGTSACKGSEDCSNGLDDNGNGKVDCADPLCTAACADPCLTPDHLGDGDDTTGLLDGHTGSLKPSCADKPGGAQVVYTFKPANTGILTVSVAEGKTPINVSVRTGCASDASEIACSNTYEIGPQSAKQATAKVTQGEAIFLVVSADGGAKTGAFTIEAHTHQVMCGDGIIDDPEQCDDSNLASGDGCSATCQVESTETEPNDVLAQANPLTKPWYARIFPAGDVDFVKIDVASPASLAVSTSGFGPTACSNGSTDTFVTIYDAGGSMLGSNDDAGGGSLCSTAVAPHVTPGTYYASTAASPNAGGASTTFGYGLTIALYPCGNGVVDPGEECDDGNTKNGDGCSSVCLVEVTESEPNNTIAQANTYSSPWRARINPNGDIDVVSVTVPGPASTITAMTGDPGGGNGCQTTIDTYVQILKADGTVLGTNDDANGYCSLLSVPGLAAGKYFVRVQAPPLLAMSNVYIFPYALTVTVQ